MSLYFAAIAQASAHYPRLSSSEINITFVDNFLRQQDFGIDQSIWLTDVCVWTTLLGAAVCKKDYELIDHIISHNADVNARSFLIGDSVLEVAAQKGGDVKMFKKLQSLGANIYKSGSYFKTLLMTAVEYENYEIVKYLIEEGIDINALHPYRGKGPLHRAVSTKNEKIIELLLNNNAEIDSKQKCGNTPLSFAISSREMNIIKLLIERGADINKATYWPNIMYNFVGYEIDSMENYESKLPFFKFFLSFDEQVTDVNRLNNEGETILHYKFFRITTSEIWSFILDAGVDVNIKNTDGQVALYSDPNDCNKIFAIKRHIVKLMSAGLTVCEENRQAVENGFEDLKNDCQKEIDKLKVNKIGASNITFFNALSMTFHYLAIRLKYAGLDEVIDEEKLRIEYPLYGRMLFYKLSKVNRRIKYLKDIEEHIEGTLCKLTLPLTFIRELWYYFSNIELNKLKLYKNHNI